MTYLPNIPARGICPCPSCVPDFRGAYFYVAKLRFLRPELHLKGTELEKSSTSSRIPRCLTSAYHIYRLSIPYGNSGVLGHSGVP